jgi:dTDP-4-dehydrorhamnose 3,5-epimerase
MLLKTTPKLLPDSAEFCYKCTDFYRPGDEGGLAWNDPNIAIKWPQLVSDYKGNASVQGYTMEDGSQLILSEKEKIRNGRN